MMMMSRQHKQTQPQEEQQKPLLPVGTIKSRNLTKLLLVCWLPCCLVCFVIVGFRLGSSSFSVTTTSSKLEIRHVGLSASDVIIINNASHKNSSSNETMKAPEQNPQHKYSIFYNNKVLKAPVKDKLEVRYPFLPAEIVSKCRLEENNNNSSNGRLEESSSLLLPEHPLERSLAYIKPHKTGSTTITSILNRIIYGRNLYKMIPKDYTYLGWPDDFPGNVLDMERVLGHTKYDGFNSHAVMSNRSHIARYLRKDPYIFTILREPLSRTISAYNFFPHLPSPWSRFIHTYYNQPPFVNGWRPAMALNNLAFALGWYHQPDVNRSRAFDHNFTMIHDFLRRMDQELDLVMMLEHLPESLVLLKQDLPQLSLQELVWLDYDGPLLLKNKTKEYPTEEQRAKLEEMLVLDRIIYQHFAKRFQVRWETAVSQNPQLLQQKEALQCAHDELLNLVMMVDDNDDEKDELSITKKFYGMPLKFFEDILRVRQKESFGSDG